MLVTVTPRLNVRLREVFICNTDWYPICLLHASSLGGCILNIIYVLSELGGGAIVDHVTNRI